MFRGTYFEQTLPLCGETIDRISEEAEAFLTLIGTEHANILTVRLSMEEALLRLLDRFGEGVPLTVSMERRFFSPSIALSLPGTPFDPMEDREDMGIHSEHLLRTVGLSPVYTYVSGKNTLTLKLPRFRKSPLKTVLFTLAFGFLFGMLGRFFPESIKDGTVRIILAPVHSLVFRMLNVIAGPVIFFTVINAVCGAGSVAARGKNGRKLLLRFFILSLLIASVALFIALPFFPCPTEENPWSGAEFTGMLDFVFHTVPSDVFKPFIDGESHQIIVLALIIGNALLILGHRARRVTRLSEELGDITLLASEWMSRLIPYFIALLLVMNIWNGNFSAYLWLWKPFLIFLVISLLLMAIYLVILSRRTGLSPIRLIQKLSPSFWVALRTASADAAYGETLSVLNRGFGVNRHLTDYALPLGLVLYMPSGSVATLIMTLYAASSYGVEISVVWLISLVALTVILLLATPPLPGIGLLAYAGIFAQLGIPSDGFLVAMIADLVFGFFTAAFNQAMLQCELVLEADRMKLLDRKKLT